MWFTTLNGYADQGTTSTTCQGHYFYYTTTATTTSSTVASCSTYQYQQLRNVYLNNNAAQTLAQSNWDGYASRDWLTAQRRKQAAELETHAAAAKERARNLLLENLNAGQRETFEKNGWFVVEGGRSKKQYRIGGKEGHIAANIEVLDGKRTSHRLCGHCDVAKAPLGDQLLAQKLMLEHSEDDFLRIANRHAA